MEPLFEKCIKIILKHEGGHVNHPKDPGGETNFGICRKYYPDEDIKNLTVERAKEIYYYDYWLRLNLSGIENENLVLQIFDFGVNAGRRTAIKLVQKICNVCQDGIIGPQTKSAINNYQGNILYCYEEGRRVYYKILVKKKPELQVFLKGWLNRVNKCKFLEI